MTCPRCRTYYEASRGGCPRCGAVREKTRGTFQTSTVLISAGPHDMVYRSVDDVPGALRRQLLKSTNGPHSATILIADRRGRREIARAMRGAPAPVRRRIQSAVLGASGKTAVRNWLTPARRKAIVAVILLLTIAAIGLVFTHAW